MRVCHFEDRGVGLLEPLTSTRPSCQLRCGQTTLRSKQARHFAGDSSSVLVRPQWADCFRMEHPDIPVNDPAWLTSGPAVLVNGRWLPPPDPAGELSGPVVGLVGEEIAYAVLGPEQLASITPQSLDDCLERWKDSLPRSQAGGILIRYPWDLVEQNPAQLWLDFQHSRAAGTFAPCPESVSVVGPRDRLLVDRTARLDPLVVVDTSGGPVLIDQDAVIHSFSRIEGPCYVGSDCQVLGAKLRAGSTLGPCCRVGGEVEASILHGFSNKYHDGFLGHSYIGEWVNLGAGTCNSDLRNDYGPVTVILHGEPIKTGLGKVGCFLGDHTKTAIGTLLNTGSNIGAFCNVVPAGPLLPKYLPPFTTWWNGTLREARELSDLLEMAAKVMRRRGCTFTEAHSRLYAHLFETTAAERRRALREAETRKLRRSA
jgi:UDP-N-acetylglucosamine diphosphorylase/glucosamine-1-phosphate N-acetyltransferase